MDKVQSFFITSATIIGVAGVSLTLLLYFFQNKILYLPGTPNRLPSENEKGYRNPGESKLTYDDVVIKTADGVKLHGWLVKMADSTKRPTLVYFQENAGNIGTRIPFMQYIQRFLQVNVMLIAYRGYSYSEGEPTEEGLQQDAVAVIDHAFKRDDIDPEQIFIFGRSLGGAVSIYGLTQTKNKVRGVVLENTFSSIPDMVDVIFPKLARLKGLVLKNYWPSVDRIRNIQTPMLFIMGLKDELIPPKQMDTLFKAAEKAVFKERFEVQDGGHNDTWAREIEQYFITIRKFMQRCLESPSL